VLNRRGWLTAPYKRTQKPRPFSPAYIRWIFTNPRYAGLAAYKGEIVGKGQWPAYIGRQEHERIAQPQSIHLITRMFGCVARSVCVNT
jgi:hypothetical protein